MKRIVSLISVVVLSYLACAAPNTLPVTIGWTASPDPSVTGYYVYFLTSTGWQQFTNVGPVTQYTFPMSAILTTTNIGLTARDASNNESQFATVLGSTTVSNLTVITVIPPGQLKKL